MLHIYVSLLRRIHAQSPLGHMFQEFGEIAFGSAFSVLCNSFNRFSVFRVLRGGECFRIYESSILDKSLGST